MQQQQNYPNSSHLVPLSNYDVTELKLENGHLAIHGLGGLVRAKPTNWSNRACDTLESVVHQATTCHKAPDLANLSSSSGGAWTGNSGQRPLTDEWIRKRTRSDSDYHGKNVSSTTSTTSNVQEEHARYQRDNTTTINTWASFESLMTKSNDDDSTCHEGMDNRDEERKITKDDESSRSQSKRPRRVAAIHNQSERKRRDRINQKMKALQRLVPNASKTDKASMLDEVIRYLEQLQAQVQIMNSMRNNMHPHMNMMMPLGMQQQQQQQQQHLHQMSVLARMGMTPVVPGALGMGMGMGMLDVSNMARMAPHQSLQQPVIHPSPASFLPPFMAAQLMQPKPDHPAVVTNASSEPMANPYCALLAQQQSMNMDFFNKMAALYRQQVNHQAAASSPSQSNH